MPLISLQMNLGITKKYALSQSMPFHSICLIRESTVQRNGHRCHPNDESVPMDIDPLVFTQIR